jgi:hypothetical protein
VVAYIHKAIQIIITNNLFWGNLIGSNSSGAPSTDITGVPRPQGSGVDIGAYETLTTGIFSPTVEPNIRLESAGGTGIQKIVVMGE